MSDRRDSGYRDNYNYRGGYQRPYTSSPYNNSPRGGYQGRGGYRGGRGGYEDRSGGYEGGRGGYQGNRDRYSGGRGDFQGRSSYSEREPYRRDSGYQRPEQSQPQRYQQREEVRTPDTSNRTPVTRAPQTTRTDVQTTYVDKNARPHENAHRQPLKNISPWTKLLGTDQSERVEKALGSNERSKLEDTRKALQSNYIKTRDSDKKLKDLEKEMVVFGMKLSSLEASVNGLETFRVARADVIESITLLGD